MRVRLKSRYAAKSCSNAFASPDDATLLARQFCDCLRDRINDFIGFLGVDFG
jgi:hypothetical protein